MSDSNYQVYAKCGTDANALTPNTKDRSVVLQKFEPSNKSQAWHKLENKDKSSFVLVNPHTNQAVDAAKNDGEPLGLVSFDETSIESMPHWIEGDVSAGYVPILPAGSNPTQMCWTVFDDNGVVGATVGYKKFEDGKGNLHDAKDNQQWKLKRF